MNLHLPQAALKAINKIEDRGHEAFVVGGFVRDSLLNLNPKDCDITTSARPEEVLEIFTDYPCHKTGIKHGTIMIIIDDQPIEITTYRVEGLYHDYRHPSEVFFVRLLKDDLARRDFTVNALAYNPKAGLVDHFNGVKDLGNKLLRCINDPYERFNEDPLRIMRALRFSSTYQFQIEEKTNQALLALYPLLDHIAQERITSEFLRLLEGDNRNRIIHSYIPVWTSLFPRIFQDNGLLINDLLAKDFQKTNSIDSSLALFLKTEPLLSDNDLMAVLKRMRLSRNQIRPIILINRFSNYSIKDKTELKMIMRNSDQKIIMDILNLQYAESLISSQTYKKLAIDVQEIIDNKECYRIDQLAISGKEIIDQFQILPSMIKTYLEKTLDEVINKRLDNEYQAQIDYLKSIIKNKD